MPTVAEQLREAREAQKLDVYQVAEITKIKTDHIRALETGRYGVFTAPVYIRGFVRTYARVLKLDEGHIMAGLDAELGQLERFREPPKLTDEPRTLIDFLSLQISRLNWRWVTAGVALLAVVATGFAIRHFQQRRQEDPLKSLGPGLYQPRGEASGEVLPVPVSAPKR